MGLSVFNRIDPVVHTMEQQQKHLYIASFEDFT